MKVSQRQRSIYLLTSKYHRYSSFDREKIERLMEYSMERREKRGFDDWEASNYPSECHVFLLLTMMFSPHGRAPPISWHMCNILRSPCLSLPTSRRFPRKKRSTSVLTSKEKLPITDRCKLHNFHVTTFHCPLVSSIVFSSTCRVIKRSDFKSKKCTVARSVN